MKSLTSTWFIVLEICMAITAAYLIVKLLRTPNRSQTQAKPRRLYFIILVALQIVVIFATIVWPLLISTNPSTERIIDRVEVIVTDSNKKATPFDDLVITLLTINLEEQPDTYTVSATVSSTSYPDLPIQNEKVGYQTTYSGKNVYEIRVLKIDQIKARFLVTLKGQ